MATFFSDQLTKQRAGYSLHAAEAGAAPRLMRWTLTTPAGGGIGDVLVLAKLSLGVRVYAGQEFHGALGAGTFHLGTYAVAPDGGLGAAVSVSAIAAALACATGVNDLPEMDVTCAAAGSRYVTTAEEYLCMTNVGTAFATGIACAGWLSVA